MPTRQGLADLLSGAAGAPVNRPALEAFVANSQAKNGLVSAQTQDAMVKASQAQEQMAAWDGIKTRLIEMGAPESEASLARDAIVGANNHDPVTGMKMLAQAKLGYGNPQSQTAGQQMFEGKEAPPVATPGNFQMPAGSGLAGIPIQQSPQGAAQTEATQALAGLNEHKNADPAAFHAQVFGNTTPEGIAAINKAVHEGRLDPTRVNSRTAPIIAQMELNNPGENYNRLHADATLQSNSTFQQRANGLEIMPGILQHVTQLGKQLDGGAGYSDLRTVGKFQQFMNGELNDPAYAEYMPVRNDALLRLAFLMRGQGASDMANKTEQEAFAPTLAPYALDAWLKGQLSVLKPMIEKNSRIVHLGEAGQGTAPLTAPSAATPSPPSAPALRDTVPTVSGLAPAAPPANTLASYPSEAAALAAGYKVGDRVTIGGVSGTLQ